MAELPITVSVSDVSNPNLLVRLLRAIAGKLASLGDRIESIASTVKTPTFSDIRNNLQSTGTAPLNVTGLRGVLADPQPASALRYTAVPTGQTLQGLRDTQLITVKNGASAYDLYTVIGGNPSTLFKLIGSAGGGNMMTTDTNQTATSIKTWTTGPQLFQGGIDASGGQMMSTSQFSARVYSSVVTGCPTGGPTPIIFNQETYDVGGLHNTAVNNSRIVIPAGGSGIWLLVGGVEWQNSIAGTYRQVWFVQNGATILGMNLIDWPTTGGQAVHNFSTLYALGAGDYVEIWATQDSGGALNVLANSATTFFSAHHLS